MLSSWAFSDDANDAAHFSFPTASLTPIDGPSQGSRMGTHIGHVWKKSGERGGLGIHNAPSLHLLLIMIYSMWSRLVYPTRDNWTTTR